MEEVGRFEEKLGKMVVANVDKTGPEKNEMDLKIVGFIKENILKQEKPFEIIGAVERVYKKRKFHLPVRAIAEALKELSEEKQKELLDGLFSKPDKAITYHLVAQLLTQGRIDQALERLAFCCDRATDNCRKVPTKEVIEKLHYALFKIPGLEEKPIKALMDVGISDCVSICLLYLTFDPGLRAQRKGVHIITEEKVLSAAATSWFKLSAENQRIHSEALRSLFHNARNRQFIRDVRDKLNIPSEFIRSLAIEETPPVNVAPVEGQKPEPTEQITASLSGTSIPEQKNGRDNEIISEKPMKALKYIEKWIVDIQEFSRSKGREVDDLSAKYEDALSEIERLKHDMGLLTAEYESQKSQARLNEENASKTEAELRMQIAQAMLSRQQYAEEIERHKDLEIQEAKNRIAADLRFAPEDLRKLREDEDTADKSRILGKYIENIFSILEKHGVRIGI